MSKIINLTEDLFVPAEAPNYIYHNCNGEEITYNTYNTMEDTNVLIYDWEEPYKVYCDECKYIVEDADVLEKYNFLYPDQHPYPIKKDQ